MERWNIEINREFDLKKRFIAKPFHRVGPEGLAKLLLHSARFVIEGDVLAFVIVYHVFLRELNAHGYQGFSSDKSFIQNMIYLINHQLKLFKSFASVAMLGDIILWIFFGFTHLTVDIGSIIYTNSITSSRTHDINKRLKKLLQNCSAIDSIDICNKAAKISQTSQLSFKSDKPRAFSNGNGFFLTTSDKERSNSQTFIDGDGFNL